MSRDERTGVPTPHDPGTTTIDLAEHEALRSRLAKAERRLAEAEETLTAIRSGGVDAIVVSEPGGEQRVYTLTGADAAYRTLIEHLGEGVATIGPDGVLQYANRRLAALLHTTPETLVGTRLVDHAQFVGLVVSDLTERRETERLLTRREALLNESQRVAHVGGWEYDVATQKVTWTDEVYRIHGVSRESFDPNDESADIAFYEPEDRQRIATAFQRAVEEGEPYDFTLRFDTAQGQRLWVRTAGEAERRDGRVVRVFGYVMDVTDVRQAQDQLQLERDLNNATLVDATGRRTHIVATGVDITEQKRAQDEIARLNAELEQRVRDRTAELEAANRNLREFTYSVSHDLRAPLRGLSGFSEALLDEYGDRLDGTGRGYAQRIRDASIRMGEVIDDLLVLSRVSQAEMCTSATVDLARLARQTVETLRAADPDRVVRVSIPDEVIVRGDARLLCTVLENLFDNAWKFTATTADPFVEFGVLLDEGGGGGPEGGTVHCFVRDNGAGFDPAYTDNLFRPFSRLHSATQFPGTGVGLAIVKSVVERHGGECWAEGRPGAGATIHFTLAP